MKIYLPVLEIAAALNKILDGSVFSDIFRRNNAIATHASACKGYLYPRFAGVEGHIPFEKSPHAISLSVSWHNNLKCYIVISPVSSVKLASSSATVIFQSSPFLERGVIPAQVPASINNPPSG